MTTFANPAESTGGDTFPPADARGHLLICYATEYIPTITTVHGDSSAVKLNVADLDTGQLHTNVLWFGRILVDQLHQRLNQGVLARMSQGAAQPGKSAPWLLMGEAHIPESAARGEAWLAANPGALSGMAQPAPVAAAPVAPQPAPVAAPAPAAVATDLF